MTQYIGLDAHSKTCIAVVMDSKGKILIESCAVLQFEMLFYPVDISSGVSVSLRQWMA